MGRDEERRCGCLCDTWGHQLDTCNGKGETIELFGSQLIGAVVVLLCEPCRDAIKAGRGRYRLAG